MKNKKIIFTVIIVAVILEIIAIIALLAHKTISEALFSTNNINSTNTGAENFSSKTKSNFTEKTTSVSNKPAEETIPALGPVPSSYFDDALFIGDSRTVGLRAFGSFTNSAFFAKTGISVNSLFDYPTLDEETSLTLTQTLLQKEYRKIYIMIGVNDLGVADLNEFSDQFFNAISQIQAVQPKALIYIQSILGLTVAKEATAPNTYSNATVLARNALLETKCDGKNLIYLDVFSAFKNAEGYLDSNCSSDGIHLNSTSYTTWCDYLMAHALPLN